MDGASSFPDGFMWEKVASAGGDRVMGVSGDGKVSGTAPSVADGVVVMVERRGEA
jgi:hypothetical protein